MRTLTLALSVLALAGCGSSDPAAPPGPVTLLVADGNNSASISVWRPDGDAVDGDVAPDSVLGGVLAQFVRAFGVHRDARTDTLIVGDAESAAIFFFDAVAGLDGDVPPTRILQGASTLLTSDAYETFVDEIRDILYVALADRVLAFAAASTLDGDVAPARQIAGPSTQLDGGSTDKRLFVDAAADRLYVLDSTGGALHVWDGASAVDGNVAPSRSLAGGSTGFDFPWGLAVDVGRDLLYVADESAHAVFVFTGASTIAGDVAPTRMLAGPTSTLESPAGIDVDPILDRLYVSHAPAATAACGVWNDASTRDGDVAPDRSISGPATGIAATADIAVSR